MKNLSAFIKQHKSLSFLFCLTLLHSIIYKTCLTKVLEPQWFTLASELGDLMYNLDLGLVTSIFFYYIVVFLTERKHKKLVAQKVEYHSQLIINEGLSLYWHFQAGQTEVIFPPDKISCERICKEHKQLETNSKDLSWYDLVESKYQNVSHEIRSLYQLPTTLTYFQNSEFVGVITKLGDAGLFQYFNGTRLRWIWNRPTKGSTADISHLKSQLYEFFQLISKLIDIHRDEFGEESFKKAIPHVFKSDKF
jgi:hypothetical protein